MNNNTHPCANKCSEFKEGGQCFFCLINETVNQGVYVIGRINLRQDDTPMVTRTVELKKGDCVVFDSVYRTSAVLKIAVIADNKGYVVLEIKNKRYIADLSEIRLATNVEIKAGHRIDHIVEVNDMVDDAHIENHISPLCKTTGQKVLVLESDKQIIERLKAENKMLHEAAATHLRNQHRFKGLYDDLVEQLYPYALDLKEQPNFSFKNCSHGYQLGTVAGYKTASENASFEILEMLKGDEEYIRAQCGMLGGEE